MIHTFMSFVVYGGLLMIDIAHTIQGLFFVSCSE